MAACRVSVECYVELEERSFEVGSGIPEPLGKGVYAALGERYVVTLYCLGPRCLEVGRGDVHCLDWVSPDACIAQEETHAWKGG